MFVNKSTLPSLTDKLYLTDGGLETTLIFLQGYDLPCFAAFDIFKEEAGYNALLDYYRGYLNIAKKYQTGFILESPTWRANPDWLEKIGYPKKAVREINEKAVQLLVDLKREYLGQIPEILISGCVGPRGDGYKPGQKMTVAEAETYHKIQMEIFRQCPVDLVSAMTLNYVEEAIGITRAASHLKLPLVLSFTVETDGKLPSGKGLGETIEEVDGSVQEPPLYYMINCAHPTHFIKELEEGKGEKWLGRIRGIRANASCKSHAELDMATELDRGNPNDLGKENKELKDLFQQLNVFGGCCGTDAEHVTEIARLITAPSF